MELENKYPRRNNSLIKSDSTAVEGYRSGGGQEEYNFFPEVAPLASARTTSRNYKAELETLGQVDDFLTEEFLAAGYKDQLHYYYAAAGYAMTSSLERFNPDGAPVSADKRFVKSVTDKDNLSIYETFKSMFMDLEFDYRMFALVIDSKETVMSRNGMTPSFAQDLIKNSFDSLPSELKSKKLSNKVLSVFVYHFHQNDIGQVPELDLSGKISTLDYLKRAGLSKIIQ